MRGKSILISFLLASAFVFATSIRPMSVERLTSQSTHIVYAHALSHRSAWNADHTRIFTYTQFRVAESMKGNTPSVITVKQIGGHAGGYNMKVAGVRYWQNGEDAVLFLQQTPEDGTFAVTGLMQGDFRISRQNSGEVVVSNGVPEVTQLSPSGEFQQYRGSKMTLRELVERVQKASGR